ncbi:hypothetical protein [Bacillus solitudinis]|uniref:hypothetical protein n=1 Tax=Bacillus solitudinis TaxID=2014074 RepID=UPI000C24D60D|nr:hypothetical protein [Bacillus solitudinis]
MNEEFNLHTENSEEVVEKVQKAIKAAVRVWNDFKEWFTNIAKTIYERFKEIVAWISKNPPVGYKRLFKKAELDYYNSIAEGRSNNWRKARGLPLIRGV